MTDFDNLSDDALRTKLIEHGFPVMPITGTTRKIMIKKLKLLQENKKKQNAIERRTMAKYSSDDDSEVDRKVKTRRATVAPVVNVRASTKVQTNGNHDKKSVATATLKPKFKSRGVEVRHFVGDTSSDTETEVVLAPRKTAKNNQKSRRDVDYSQSDDTDEDNSLGINMKNTSSFSNTSMTSSSSVDSPPKLFTTTPRVNTPSLQRPQPVIPPAKSTYSAFQSTLSHSQQATSTPGDEYDSETNRRARHTTYGYLSRAQDDIPLENSPYLQNFSKRLSLLTQQQQKQRDDPTRRVKRTERQEIRVQASGDSNIFIRTKQRLMKLIKSDTRRRISTNTNCRTTSTALKSEENTGNFISLALVAAVGVFFVILLALYYGMHRGSNTNDIVGLKVPYCTSTVTIDCLTQDEALGGIDLYKIFKPQLIELAIDYHCGDLLTSAPLDASRKKKTYMTDADIVRFITNNYKIQDERAIRQDIDSFVLIAHHNQFLGVSVLMVDENSDGDDYKIIDDVKQSNQELLNGHYTRAFAVLSPSLPWRCSFWQKVSALLKAAVVILSVAAILHISKYGYKHIKHYQHKKKEEVMMLVEKILEIMQTQSGDDQYLVINHVRDMIIAIDQRKTMEAAWKKALAFIDENESRIRTEVQVVKGESYEVWRWIGGQNVSMNCTNASANKSWQGQAFEVQTPPCSPTPCLKIRGMIDDGDRNCNKTTIREAILSKCAQCRVLHVSVDINTKCVYLKCADTNDAAIAYRSLHGNWFAGHLVTVKYLRLERYMQRFPDSPLSGPPFLKV